MTGSLAEQLTSFMNPKLVDEEAIRQILEDLPDSERHGFRSEANTRLDQLEQVLRPFGSFSNPSLNEQGYPTVRFDSEEQLLQIASALETIRLKRRLLREVLEA